MTVFIKNNILRSLYYEKEIFSFIAFIDNHMYVYLHIYSVR